MSSRYVEATEAHIKQSPFIVKKMLALLIGQMACSKTGRGPFQVQGTMLSWADALLPLEVANIHCGGLGWKTLWHW